MNALKPHIIQISDTQLLIYQLTSLTMQCRNQTKTVEGCDFCVLTIPCHCVVLTDTNKFLPHVITCDSDKQDITKVHPLNLALLQHFFKEDDISFI